MRGWLRSVPREQGFTIVESVVALAIIFGLLLILLRGLDTSLRTVVEAKRQGAASALASELVERARSLEWIHVGLTVDANGTDCPSDVGCSTILTEFPEISINANGNYAFGDEEVVFANGPAFDPFISFHEQVTRDDTTYDRYLFVTSVRDDPLDQATERFRRITAVVRWAGPGGFPNEVRLVSFMSQFSEPSQPLLRGNVDFDGGQFTLDGRIGGTAGFLGPGFRDDAVINLVMPGGSVEAITDYVSFAAARGQGTSADARSTGPDKTMFTADDVLSEGPAQVEERYADDDAGSAPPINNPSTTPVAFATWDFGGGGQTAAELLDTGDLDLVSQPDRDNLEYTGVAETRQSVLVADDLPYADLHIESAEQTAAGFIEYTEPNIRAQYEIWIGDDLDAASYEFRIFRVGDESSGEAHDYAGTTDRNDNSGDREVQVVFDWEGEDVYLVPDSYYGPATNDTDFKGWVWIELPRLRSDGGFVLEAGENASYPPKLEVVDDLVVHFWNPSSGSYTTEFKNFSKLACGASQTFSLSEIQTLTPADDHPYLTYEVDAQVTVTGACASHTLYPSGDVTAASVLTDGFVRGSVDYLVRDDMVVLNLPPSDGVLFDYRLEFDLGGVDATALFLDPSQS